MQDMKPYKLVRSRRRTIGLVVTSDASLVVRAPHREPLHSIERFIREKSAWIQRTIAWARSRPRSPRKQFIDGETFLFLGRPYPLNVVAEAARPLAFQNGFVLREEDRDRARALFEAWYKAEARRRIVERVSLLARDHGLTYRSVKINSAKRRWGSCTPEGSLNFSWRLVMTPPEAIDYVVIHELAHLRHPNHSRSFWKCVASMCPDYAASRRWLRENAGLARLD